jgi:serine/threonine-protein kinase
MHGATVVLVAVVTSIAASAGTVYLNERYGILPSREKPAEAAVVPALNGLTETDARANAQRAHLALLVASHETNAEAKPGTVIRQSVAPGQVVARDTSVNVVLADEVPKVPGITGLTLAEATSKLEQHGYAIQMAGTVPDGTVAAGLVLDQSPKAEMAQTKGSAVVVHLSAGPADVAMPKVVGVGVNQAKTDLEKLGVKPVIRWVALAETPTYVVLNQKPAPGDKVKAGAEVQLTACR